MPDSPFSPARLHQLHFTQGWRPDQIALLATANTGVETSEAEVRAWFAAAGLAVEAPAPAPKPAKRARPRRVRQPGEGTLTVPCDRCNAPVTRRPSEFGDGETFCSRTCHAAHAGERARAKKAARQARTEAPVGEKPCDACKLPKKLSEFSRDVSRGDGRARTCLECGRAKSKRYYRENQARLQAKARARKRAKRELKLPS